MRLSFVGELGWELHIPKDACLPVYRAVMAAGEKHGIINSGYRAIDSLSIEKGNVGPDLLIKTPVRLEDLIEILRVCHEEISSHCSYKSGD